MSIYFIFFFEINKIFYGTFIACIAFRFVFEPTYKNSKNNFLPVLILKPARQNGRRFKKDSSKCQGYALSCLKATTRIVYNKGFLFRASNHVSQVFVQSTHLFW